MDVCARVAPSQAVTDRLTDVDKRRLVEMASLFDIQVELRTEDAVLSGHRIRNSPVILPLTRAYPRLVSELCSITTRWIPYGPKQPCEQYLLGLTDTRIHRLGELYRIWQASLSEDAGESTLQ